MNPHDPYNPLNGYTFAEIVVVGRARMTHPFLMVPRIGEVICLPRAARVMPAIGEERLLTHEEIPLRPKRERIKVEGVEHFMDEGREGARVRLLCSVWHEGIGENDRAAPSGYKTERWGGNGYGDGNW